MKQLLLAFAIVAMSQATASASDSALSPVDPSEEVAQEKSNVELAYDAEKELLTINYHLIASNGCGAKIAKFKVVRGSEQENGLIAFRTASAAKAGQMCTMALRPVTLTAKVRDFRANAILNVNGQDLGLIVMSADGLGVSFESNPALEAK